jgi:hypothetical protein
MNRKSRNWADVQLIISSVSIALTLGLWSLFASREKIAPKVSEVEVITTPTTAAPEPTAVMMAPGQTILLGAPAPQIATTNLTTPKRRKSGGGGGGGASTGSS